MSEFDDDTALTRDGDVWRGTVSERWHVGAGPNGGYLATFPLRAMLDVAPRPDPLSLSTYYLQRPAYGPIEVRVRVLHATKSHAYLAADVHQEASHVLTALAVFGRMRESELSPVRAPMPEVVPLDDSVVVPPPDDPSLEFVHRFEVRMQSADIASFFTSAGNRHESAAWLRFVDRDLDALGVPVFADCLPPAIFGALGPGVMPTLELTVHWRTRPRTRWHWARFATRFYTGGYIEEDGEIWGEDGTLVAMSRQLARFTPMIPPG
jgi:hypothetical protein